MYRHNSDERLRQLERSYHSDLSPQTLIQLNAEKLRSGIMTELGIEHLRYLAEGVAAIIGAKPQKYEVTVTWDGKYQGIDIHINARRLYGKEGERHPFLQIGRRLAYFEIPMHPMIELYADSEPMNINFGKEQDYFQASPHQPWVYDPQLFLDYLMELNQRMEEGEWYRDWKEANSYWLRENPKKIRKMVKTRKRRPAQIIKLFQYPPTGTSQYTNEELLQLKEEYYRRGKHLLYPEFDFGCKECGSEWKHRYFCSKDPKSGFRRNPISSFLTPEESDKEINEKALPIFHDFRYRESEYIWYRTGNSNEFSEFTFCPSKMLGSQYCSPRMSGGRGSGIATGQYSFCSPQPDTVEVMGPRNPFIVSHKDVGEDPAYRFSRLARTLLRMAETVSGKHDWTQKGHWGISGLGETPFPVRNLKDALQDPLTLILGIREHRNPRNILPPFDELGKQIISAIIDWKAFKQVHPLNILLSRLGFDGVSWAGEALKYGDCGDYGCLLFPPITYMGEVVGLNPTKSIYMLLP
jgi:hypothetical protein